MPKLKSLYFGTHAFNECSRVVFESEWFEERVITRFAWTDIHSTRLWCIWLQQWQLNWVDNAGWSWFCEIMHRFAKTYYTRYRSVLPLCWVWVWCKLFLPIFPQYCSWEYGCLFALLARYAFPHYSHSPICLYQEKWTAFQQYDLLSIVMNRHRSIGWSSCFLF